MKGERSHVVLQAADGMAIPQSIVIRQVNRVWTARLQATGQRGGPAALFEIHPHTYLKNGISVPCLLIKSWSSKLSKYKLSEFHKV